MLLLLLENRENRSYIGEEMNLNNANSRGEMHIMHVVLVLVCVLDIFPVHVAKIIIITVRTQNLLSHVHVRAYTTTRHVVQENNNHNHNDLSLARETAIKQNRDTKRTNEIKMLLLFSSWPSFLFLFVMQNGLRGSILCVANHEFDFTWDANYCVRP